MLIQASLAYRALHLSTLSAMSHSFLYICLCLLLSSVYPLTSFYVSLPCYTCPVIVKSSHLYIVPLDILIPIAARDLHLVNIYMSYIVWMGIDLNLYRAAIGLHYVRVYAPLQRIKHILIMSQFFKTFLTGMISDLALQFKCAFVTLFLYKLQAMTGIVLALLYLRLLLRLSNDIETQPGPRDSDDHVLSIFHLNIRSLRNKIPYLCDIAGEYTHRQKLSNSKLVLNIKNVSYQTIGN